MLTLAKFIAVGLAGVALGLVTTYQVLQHDMTFDAVQAGPWTSMPKSGTLDIDPYDRAILARSGELPLGNAEGLSFIARTDSSGTAFRPRCDYVVSGSVPPARYWTLSLVTPNGLLIDNLAKRYGFTSAEILRASNGTFAITVSRQVRPDNWLPAGDAKAYVLMLRLYDTLLDFGTSKVDAASLPKIARGQCE